jgi:hypothetical protein
LNAVWAFLAAAVAASVTLAGALFTRAQTRRTETRLTLENARAEERLALDTVVSGLKLLTVGDGYAYAPPGVIVAVIGTLVHLKHQVIALRLLAACWDDGAVDTASAMWLIGEILESSSQQAQLEATAMLDAHSGRLCLETPGSFSWPRSIEFHWITHAPLPARLHVLRAVLRTLTSRNADWWHEGGRQGWAVVLLREAVQTDVDRDIKSHAAAAAAILIPLLRRYGLTSMQSADDWVPLDDVEHELSGISPSRRKIVMLAEPMAELGRWASA